MAPLWATVLQPPASDFSVGSATLLGLLTMVRLIRGLSFMGHVAHSGCSGRQCGGVTNALLCALLSLPSCAPCVPWAGGGRPMQQIYSVLCAKGSPDVFNKRPRSGRRRPPLSPGTQRDGRWRCGCVCGMPDLLGLGPSSAALTHLSTLCDAPHPCELALSPSLLRLVQGWGEFSYY